MSNEHAGNAPEWMQEQAAEYADLVGSFVESVVDSDTDEMIEYQLIWEGGDLGVALTTIEGGEGGVAVSRVTGKGFPFGIKNVGPGDLLLSINMKDTTKMNLDDVVAYLQICDLPATLRFKKLSPVVENVPAPVPRKNTYVITSGTAQGGPTSPMGSAAPPSGPRSSPAPPPLSHPARASMPVTHNIPSEFPEPPAPPQRQSAKVPATKKITESLLVSVPPTVHETNAFDGDKEYPPVDERPHPSLKPEADMPVSTYKSKQPPHDFVAPEDKLCELDGLVLTSGENDLGFEESEDESVSRGSRDSWRDESFDVDARHGGSFDIDASNNALNVGGEDMRTDTQPDVPKETRNKARFQPDESGSTAVPSDATHIAAVDNANGLSPADLQVSPRHVKEQVRPSDMSSSMASSMNSSMNNTAGPQPAVRMSWSTAPLMKSHPISSLHGMCLKGDLRGLVQHLRVEGPEALLDREPNHGQTGLHLAARSGKVPLVKVILEQYKPLEEIINIEDDKGNTALHFAATKTPALVHLLLENGASANVKNGRKFTPLIISVITSKDDSVIIPRMLLKYGANPNDMHDSHTVIHTAINSGRLNIAGALIRAGAKMDVEDAEGKSVFEKLSRKDLRYLISHIYFPPTHITKKERSDCMLCHQKFKFGCREHNCTHCGRLCCTECASLHVEMYKFPMGFPGRTRRGAANREKKRVCKTCFNVFKERNEDPEKSDVSRFINRVINIEWDEVNPDKLQKEQEASRRGDN